MLSLHTCDVWSAFLWPQKNFVVLLITMFGSIKFLSLLCFLLPVNVGFCAEENKPKFRSFPSRYSRVSVYKVERKKNAWKKFFFLRRRSSAKFRCSLCCDSTFYHVLCGWLHSRCTTQTLALLRCWVFFIWQVTWSMPNETTLLRGVLTLWLQCALYFSRLMEITNPQERHIHHVNFYIASREAVVEFYSVKCSGL